MGYDETLMYGQYQRDLGDYAKKQASFAKAQKLRDSIRKRQGKKEPPAGFRFYAGKSLRRLQAFKSWCQYLKNKVITRIGADWIFLTTLGVVMALLSFVMDYVIGKCQLARVWLFEELKFSVPGQYFTWILFPLIFICFSTGFVHVVGPNAIGSGIPEMKTILRGVVLHEYLTFRTMVSKVVGLCTSLGCGLPIGKEGPFVHIASIMARLLGKVITSFKGIYENESRNTEMLAAACAVGVACTFAAPIGGVLFSIEVTATYFAVQNYWRGFYSAVCAAFVFRLLAIWFTDEETLTALFKTSLRQEFPFDPLEMTAFCVIGIACGFGGALFVFIHRRMVEFIRNQKKAKSFLQKNRFIFPSVVVFVLTSITFPPGFGYYMAGHLTNHDAVNQMFSNFSLSVGTPSTTYEDEVMKNWRGPANNVFITLTFFIVMKFWMSALAVTLPVPAGVFMPVFTIGAAFGRLVGECMATWFPYGVGGHLVVPGGYAIVGAAALSGSVTHTISTSVIVFELTGQMAHVLPCVVAVLLSNATAHCLQPSFYDSLIQIKRLPYLPDILNPEAINAHKISVEDFMIRDLKLITSQSTYGYVKTLLEKYTFRSFPLVDSQEHRMLLGSVQRDELERLVEYQLSHERKIEYFNQLSVQRIPLPRVTLQESGLSMSEEDLIDGDTQIHYSVKRPQTPAPGVQKKSSRFNVSKVEESSRQVKKPAFKSESEDDADGGILKEQVPLSEEQENPSVEKNKLHVNWNVPFNLSQMTETQEEEWVKLQLAEVIDLSSSRVTIDPAPFQLVQKTSLYKTHSLFSLLSLHHAYVTHSGQLRGVVSLTEVRNAIQGHIIPPSTPAPTDRHIDIDSSDNEAVSSRFSVNKISEDELRTSDSEA